MVDLLRRFCRDESGGSALEYGMIAAIVALLAINSLKSIGTKLNGKFSTISSVLN